MSKSSGSETADIDMPSSFKIESSEQNGRNSVPSIIISSDSSTDDEESSTSSEHFQEEHLMQSGQRHRVRFSVVRTRSYNVVDELSTDAEPDMPPRRSLGWNYTERETDLETAIAESLKERNEKYNRLIIEHIVKAEKLKADQERIEEMKKKGWKVKAKRLFKSLGKGLIEATSKASFVVGTTPYG